MSKPTSIFQTFWSMNSMVSKLLHVIEKKLQYQAFFKAQVCLLHQIMFRVYINFPWIIGEDNCRTWRKLHAHLGTTRKNIEKFEFCYKSLTNLKFSSTSFHYIVDFVLHPFPTMWFNKNNFAVVIPLKVQEPCTCRLLSVHLHLVGHIILWPWKLTSTYMG